MQQAGKDIEILEDSVIRNSSNFRIKSDLMLQMEALEPKEAHSDDEDENDNVQLSKLTKEEIIARSKELRLLRIRESQKSAKARLQNKIKSKKFHKIMKKEKLKEQMKEFEILQKQDPEAAIRKLDQIEKQRVEERALLRHKNTGTWAKNLQVRAKYDKDVRKELAQQLAISRELTQKQRDADNDSDQESDNNEAEDNVRSNEYDPFNPWVKNGQTEKNETDFVSGYRKYWNDRNKNDEALKEYRGSVEAETINKTEAYTTEPSVPETKNKKRKSVNGWLVEDCDIQPVKRSNKIKVTKSFENVDLDDLFDDAEETLENKATARLNKLKNDLGQFGQTKNSKKSQQTRSNKFKDLSFKQVAKKPNIDEELLINKEETETNEDVNELKTLSNNNLGSDSGKSTEIDNINPNKFISVKPKHLQTALPDMEGAFDDDDDEEFSQENNKRLTIAEAFEDDDIVADFEREQDDEKKKNEPSDIDLTLPGWGSWAGAGIQPQKQNKKLILKFPKPEQRKDENKGHVIIVDQANKKLRNHQVASLPFPFTSVKDYEASIRAPIGSDFVPVTAHKLLTKPAVTTKLGTIIEPINESNLLKCTEKPKTKTDKRIAALIKFK